MFNSTVLSFDMELLGSPTQFEQTSFTEPDGAFKTIAQHMEEDKKVTLANDPNVDGSIGWLEATSDLKAFMDIGELPEDNNDNVDCDAVINEVEEFLKKHDAPKEPTDVNVGSTENVDLNDLQFTQEEWEAADNLLNELLKSDDSLNLNNGEVTHHVKEPEPMAKQETKIKIENQNDSGFFEMSNVTEVITEDGRQIVIMIAPPDSTNEETTFDTALPSFKHVATAVISPESVATEVSESEDPEWSPDSPRISKGRPMIKRNSPKKQKRVSPYITDKKERKKLQNVEAARRYRDKKKAEQNGVEFEEEALVARNKELKSQVSELEAEMKTMKKLMKELGILK